MLPGVRKDVADAADNVLLLGSHGRRVLLLTSLVLVLGVLALMAAAENHVISNPANQPSYGVLAIALFSMVLSFRHQVLLATRCLLWGLLFVLVYNAYIVQGVRTPAFLVAMPMLVTMSGWLLGKRHAMIFGATVIVIVCMLWAGEVSGWLRFSIARPADNYAMVLVMGVLVTVVVTVSALTAYISQIEKVSQLTRSLQDRVQELEHSEARFAAAFRGTPLPCVSVDEKGVLVDVSDAWLAQFGYEREAVIGKTAAQLDHWDNATDREHFYSHVSQSANHAPYAASLKSPNKPPTSFLLFTSVVQYGAERRFLISLLDQSDRLAAEAAQKVAQSKLETQVEQRTEALRQTVAQLTETQRTLVQSEKLASLGDLVAGVSHELNTPLGNAVMVATSLQDKAENMRQRVDANDVRRRSEMVDFFNKQDEMIQVLVRNTRRAAELVGSFKQIAVDRTSERRREFLLNELVHDIVEAMRPTLMQPEVVVAMAIPDGLACDSYPGPIGQILSNLIQNCVLHAFANRPGGHISIRAEADGAMVLLCVEDDGVGMSEDVLAKVFDPFFTTRMGQGGSGLGLSVSHNLASSVLGGSLSVDSAPGRGSRFTLRFVRNHETHEQG